MNVKLVAVLLVLVMCVPVGAVGYQSAHVSDGIVQSNDNLQITDNTPVKQVLPDTLPVGTGDSVTHSDYVSAYADHCDNQYNEGTILVKDSSFSEEKLGDLEYACAEPLFAGSAWQIITLNEGTDTAGSVEYLRSLNVFEQVDYDYIMGADGTIESIGVMDNPSYSSQNYIETMCIDQGWLHLYDNNISPGGNSSVIVAVIDTGVDYNHIDLRNNIWINSAEIPDNGIDDDGNGYIDDVRGWDFVGNDADPMDDNGHGTHVAGIVAAENNLIGTVGVAYNCKIMALKAGNSSGYFVNSAIAQAIQYAYMNGASVINMSFGGTSMTMAVEEALEEAYNQCVLVAAAGNNSSCNNIDHAMLHDVLPSYPAALPFVIGVMSCNSDGSILSYFSNYDDTPFNSVEYEVCACGESILSTWPNNKMSSLSGTSMACPVVSGIAALLRTAYDDRHAYPTKFIQSQIVNTGSIHPIVAVGDKYWVDEAHSFVNLYNALNNKPKPSVNLYDYYIFDSVSISDKNNGDKAVDSGEQIQLALELYNRGGVASNVRTSIDTIRNGDPSLTDPYVEIITDSINISDIGTYSVRTFSPIYENGIIVGTETYFLLKIADNCPNDYIVNLNLSVSYTNGLDLLDKTTYTSSGTIQITVSSGFKLPSIINEDTTYDNTHKYIVASDVVIPKDVTVTFTEGCQIQFYDSSTDYYNDPTFKVFGTLEFNGTPENRISIYPSELYSSYMCGIINEGGTVNITNADLCNVSTWDPFDSNKKFITLIDSCIFYTNGPGYGNIIKGSEGVNSNHYLYCRTIANSSIKVGFGGNIQCDNIDKSYVLFQAGYFHGALLGNGIVVYNATNTFFAKEANTSTYIHISNTCVNNIFTCEETGKVSNCASIQLPSNIENTYGNTFLSDYETHCNDVIENFIMSDGRTLLSNNDYEDPDYSKCIPFISDISLYDQNNHKLNKIGTGIVTVRITFSDDMDISKNISVSYGSVSPYSDYKIEGSYISNTVWEGQLTVKSMIENGKELFRVTGASPSNCNIFIDVTYGYSFEIDTTSAQSMNIVARPIENGIELTWVQDDYETIMGYNVYRSEIKDGNYIKLNPTVIASDENTFVDVNAEPGTTYWYTFTIVLSDMTESSPAGKVSGTSIDTIEPSVYHTPINQGYLGNNLTISCTASDNISIVSSTLYYRIAGTIEWKSVSMLKQNDRYNGIIFGNELSLDGLEYYIVVFDGVNTVSKGTSSTPYIVAIKDASTLSTKGDVDGDGIVTTRDALMIMQVLKGDLILTDDQFRRADLNSDEVLSSSEALRILQYINGNVNTLTMA